MGAVCYEYDFEMKVQIWYNTRQAHRNEENYRALHIVEDWWLHGYMFSANVASDIFYSMFKFCLILFYV